MKDEATDGRCSLVARHIALVTFTVIGLTQMEELYSFLWSFLPALLAKKTTEKEIFRSAEGEKRCLHKSYAVCVSPMSYTTAALYHAAFKPQADSSQ